MEEKGADASKYNKQSHLMSLFRTALELVQYGLKLNNSGKMQSSAAHVLIYVLKKFLLLSISAWP
jgi:hypothetical protein